MPQNIPPGGRPKPPTVADLAALIAEVLKHSRDMWSEISESNCRTQERTFETQERMLEMIGKSSDKDGLDNVLICGFKKVAEQIAAQTAPLRALGRDYTPLEEPAATLLDNLNKALTRRDFSLVPSQGAIGPVKKDYSSAGGVAS